MLSAFRYLSILLCFLAFPYRAAAQQQELDTILKRIDFKQDTVQAVFQWVATELEYDLRRTLLKTKTLTWANSDKDYVREAIVTKKGICFHYARLFDALIRRLGYESYYIDGYVILDERINTQIGHVWNAVKVHNEWLMYDPTWASGYANGNTFVRRYDARWYANKPSEFIKTHIPFDPLWQFQTRPLSHNQVHGSASTNDIPAAFRFEDSIRVYQKQSMLARSKAELARIDAKGVKNDLLQDYVQYLGTRVAYYQNVEWLDLGFLNMQQAVDQYNNYIAGKNRRFKNPDWSDEAILAVPDSVRFKLSNSLRMVAMIESSNSSFNANIQSLKKKADEISAAIESEAAFIRRYLNTKKPLRRFVFTM